jgi:hypothetical protein
MNLFVQADGVPPTAAEHRDGDTPTAKWPHPGMTLPVTLDRKDPDRLKVEWDDVAPTGRAVPGTSVAAGPVVATRSATDLPEGIPPEAAEIVERITELFPGATVQVNEPVQVQWSGGALPAIFGRGADDAGDDIDQLERLAKLHLDGALIDEEFRDAKRRVLEAD